MLNDGELLREYAERGSEEAFQALVERHSGMVHGVAVWKWQWQPRGKVSAPLVLRTFEPMNGEWEGTFTLTRAGRVLVDSQPCSMSVTTQQGGRAVVDAGAVVGEGGKESLNTRDAGQADRLRTARIEAAEKPLIGLVPGRAHLSACVQN